MNETKDVPVVLNNIDYEDDYDGSFTQRRAIIYTLQFTVKTYLYGPVTDAKTIKKLSQITIQIPIPHLHQEKFGILYNQILLQQMLMMILDLVRFTRSLQIRRNAIQSAVMMRQSNGKSF
ncbi:MAG: hypothetical protein CM15mV41_0950 [Caudoviricetes sp.]|nr:MAG: hypothetical protein CM15mV41_0950 [Caudoviricetes sp.]